MYLTYKEQYGEASANQLNEFSPYSRTLNNTNSSDF